MVVWVGGYMRGWCMRGVSVRVVCEVRVREMRLRVSKGVRE